MRPRLLAVWARHRVITRRVALHHEVVEAAVGAEDVELFWEVGTVAPGAAALASPVAKSYPQPGQFRNPSHRAIALPPSLGHGTPPVGARARPNGPPRRGPFGWESGGLKPCAGVSLAAMVPLTGRTSPALEAFHERREPNRPDPRTAR